MDFTLKYVCRKGIGKLSEIVLDSGKNINCLKVFDKLHIPKDNEFETVAMDKPKSLAKISIDLFKQIFFKVSKVER